LIKYKYFLQFICKHALVTWD